jgi:hypothetical protein
MPGLSRREYEGRVYFCRFEGYFDDLHREWDRQAGGVLRTSTLPTVNRLLFLPVAV